ncbi:hypothetical protein GCM10010415_54540 [Streptomyces atrovirens]
MPLGGKGHDTSTCKRTRLTIAVRAMPAPSHSNGMDHADMRVKHKETKRGGLAVNIIEYQESGPRPASS